MVRRFRPAKSQSKPTLTCKLLLETLEDRTLLSVSSYVPDTTARSWMNSELTKLIQNPTTDQYTGGWIVGVHSGQNAAYLSSFAGVSSSRATGIIDNTFQWTFTTDVSPTAISGWMQSRLASGQIDFFYPLLSRQQTARFVPNDPQYANQWHLNNTGQGGGAPGIDANVQTAWDTVRGRNVQIAIVDSGVTVLHPDLQPNLWINPGEIAGNGMDDDGNGFIDDINGWDFNGNDNNPTPQTSDHGTSVAGVAGARGNNNVGVSGVAPEAQLIGERLIEGATNDALEAQALSYKRDITDIYSNSWGPFDDGVTLEGPGPLLTAAFADNYFNGRGGLGNIYTWAGGNGGDFETDNSNYDGYANSRFVIGVAAVGNNGIRSSYSERGANILVAAPSDGGSLGITTTAGTSTPGYTSDFGGTSSATPLVAGVIALMLEARPDLTARDVQYILVNSSRRIDASDPGWSQNNGGTGFWINDKYGFGMVDATAAVNLARTWTKVRPQISATSGVVNSGVSIPDADPNGVTVTFNATQDMLLEHVEFTVDITHTWRGDLEFILTSPKGTQSLVDARNGDSTGDFNNWKFMTVRNWGESPVGQWRLQIVDTAGLDVGTLNSFQLNFFGTSLAVPPTATNDTYTTAEDTNLFINSPGVLGNDLGAVSAQLVTNVSSGTLFLFQNGSFFYSPAANFNGTVSFTYNAVNPFGTSTATVTINVTPVNDTPIANADGTFVVRPGRLFTLAAPGLLANDSDIETINTSLTTTVFSPPSRGTLNLSSNGSFTYLPSISTGLDTFQYRASDGQASSSPATVSLRLNTPPVSQDGNTFTEVGVNATGNVLTNASDFDLNPMTASLVSTTANGTLTLLPNGNFTYIPNANFFGIDTFTFRADDQYYNSANPDQIGNTSTYSIRVNRKPVSNNDSYSTRQGQTIEIFSPGVLTNDFDLDTTVYFDIVRASIVTSTSHGSLIVDPNGNGYFKYTPEPGWTGIDSFTYRPFDGMSYGNTSTVTINVLAVPIARPDPADGISYTTFGPNLTVGAGSGVLVNDTSPNGGPLSARLVSGPSQGTLTLNPNGSFEYTAINGYTGMDTFSYVANDGTFDSEPTSATIFIFAATQPPIARDDAYTLPANSSSTIAASGVLANDSDPQLLPIQASLVSGTRNGTLFLNLNGSFTYVPQAGFNGIDSFTYRASNNQSVLSNAATVTLTVGTPPPPVTVPARRVILGAETGGTLRVLTGETGATVFTITPYSGFTGAIRVATGDVTGDGVPDIITAPGSAALGGSSSIPGVRIFNGATGIALTGAWGTGVRPFGTSYTGGIQVAAGDVNNDGKSDVVVSADVYTTSPQVRVYNGNTATLFTGWLGGFSPYTGTSFSGGVRVAIGDVNGDGKADIITSPGGGQPIVRIYNSAATGTTATPLRSFTAYTSNVAGGVFVSAGDFDGDGKVEIVTGAAKNVNGQVRVFNSQTGLVQRSLTVADDTNGPVRVAVGDIDGDGKLDLVVGMAIKNNVASRARVYDALTLSELFAGQNRFNLGNTYTGGLFVAALGKK